MFSQKFKRLMLVAALALTPFLMDVGCVVDLPVGDLYWDTGSYYDHGYYDDVYVEEEYYWEEDCYDCYDDGFVFDGFFDWF